MTDQNKLRNEELMQIAGGFVPWLEEIISPVGNENPNFIGKDRPVLPITGEPLPGEGAQFVPI